MNTMNVAKANTVAASAPDDVLVWADETWCYKHELSEMSFMSDDYLVIAETSSLYAEFLAQRGGAK